ncbi:hypothetical protein GE061_015266 [Apolygus lucorum]|uniref:Uncharacterized protein n=1 Tax=Apolygus lucorum TaxID=248454 RepID=A0A8S9XLL7_APOLU|nr:hypothetical protein GE061_015266 [Apolygus lucorum]
MTRPAILLGPLSILTREHFVFLLSLAFIPTTLTSRSSESSSLRKTASTTIVLPGLTTISKFFTKHHILDGKERVFSKSPLKSPLEFLDIRIPSTAPYPPQEGYSRSGLLFTTFI